jgi:hypothetical protein
MKMGGWSLQLWNYLSEVTEKCFRSESIPYSSFIPSVQHREGLSQIFICGLNRVNECIKNE